MASVRAISSRSGRDCKIRNFYVGKGIYHQTGIDEFHPINKTLTFVKATARMAESASLRAVARRFALALKHHIISMTLITISNWIMNHIKF